MLHHFDGSIRLLFCYYKVNNTSHTFSCIKQHKNMSVSKSPIWDMSVSHANITRNFQTILDLCNSKYFYFFNIYLQMQLNNAIVCCIFQSCKGLSCFTKTRLTFFRSIFQAVAATGGLPCWRWVDWSVWSSEDHYYEDLESGQVFP